MDVLVFIEATDMLFPAADRNERDILRSGLLRLRFRADEPLATGWRSLSVFVIPPADNGAIVFA